MLSLPRFSSSLYNPFTLLNILPFEHYHIKPKVDTCGILVMLAEINESGERSGMNYILTEINDKYNDFSSVCRESSFGSNEYCTINNAYVMSRGLVFGLNPDEIKKDGQANKKFKVKENGTIKEIEFKYCWTGVRKADDQYGNHHYFTILHIVGHNIFSKYQELVDHIKSQYLPNKIIKIDYGTITKTIEEIKKRDGKYVDTINIANGKFNTRMTAILNFIAKNPTILDYCTNVIEPEIDVQEGIEEKPKAKITIKTTIPTQPEIKAESMPTPVTT